MKVRNGFVSNSSTSSFICDVCGEIQSGYDLCLSDAEMYQCEIGHTFCESHENSWKTLNIKEKRLVLKSSSELVSEEIMKKLEEMSEAEIDEVVDECGTTNYECSSVLCPICTFREIDPDDMTKYLLKKYGLTKKDILEEVKGTFLEYSDFRKYIKNV